VVFGAIVVIALLTILLPQPILASRPPARAERWHCALDSRRRPITEGEVIRLRFGGPSADGAAGKAADRLAVSRG
jgi:hypothetical protein